MLRLILALTLCSSIIAAAAPCTELPVLFVVQDKSGSMDAAPDGSTASSSNPSKWSIAKSVVPALASNFNNRFRFGAAMYPYDTTTFNCTTGTVVSGISGTPTGITNAYNAAVPGGGTSTAATLNAVRSYIQGQGLSTPAYVLLITDGLPNCNTSLNANTCAASTPGCGPTPNASTCGLGAKDCIDDAGSANAAAALSAAGIKVFVVGFSTTLTSGNNKAVLDAIASAGGTGSAYTATNQSQLTSVLNTIAVNTTTCCHDVCTAGAAQCNANGQRQTCQMDSSIGCTTWTTSSCNSGSTCTNGTCATCNTCNAGATRCNANGDAEQCVANAQGCTSWQTADNCAYGELCSGGQCNSCQACTWGASRCSGTGIETCDLDALTGCTSWTASACGNGSTCSNGSCTACNTACAAGSKQCAGNTVQTCVANAQGCTAWQSGETCGDFCSGGACGVCGTSCTVGATRCNGSGVETCVTDANNCTTWSNASQCGTNEFCSGGACAACATSCNVGAKRCGANGTVEACEVTATGCSDWVTHEACDIEGGGVCNDGQCYPPCPVICEGGAVQCSADGTPQKCDRSNIGCFVWVDQPACGAASVCVGGVCREECDNTEFDSCPTGFVCTGTADGRYCLPTNDGGTGGGSGSNTGTGGGSGSNSGGTDGGVLTGGSQRFSASVQGCNCQVADGGSFAMLGLALAVLSRRRSTAR